MILLFSLTEPNQERWESVPVKSVQGSMQQHASLLQEQDGALDQLEGGIKRIKALGGVMKTELAEQQVMLDALDEDLEQADSQMQSMTKKLNTLIDDTKKNDYAQYGIIACLCLLLGFLTFLVMS